MADDAIIDLDLEIIVPVAVAAFRGDGKAPRSVIGRTGARRAGDGHGHGGRHDGGAGNSPDHEHSPTNILVQSFPTIRFENVNETPGPRPRRRGHSRLALSPSR